MLEPEEKEKYRNRLKNPRLDGLQKELIFKKIVELCKKHTRCPYCSEINGNLISLLDIYVWSICSIG